MKVYIKSFLGLALLLVLFSCNSANKSAPADTNDNNQTEASSTDKSAGNTSTAFEDNNVVYFAFDKYNISEEAKVKIKNQSSYLKSQNIKNITIEGYTDQYGTREYNIALGERRANSVKNVLVKAGFNASDIKVVSYGKDKQLPNSTAVENRRAVTVIATK